VSVCAALAQSSGMQSACSIFSSVVCLAVSYFSALSHKRHYFREKNVIEHNNCVFSYSLQNLSETFVILRWTMTKKEEQALLIFERKLFRRIYGPKYEDGEWKSRTNRELEELNKGENIVK